MASDETGPVEIHFEVGLPDFNGSFIFALYGLMDSEGDGSGSFSMTDWSDSTMQVLVGRTMTLFAQLQGQVGFPDYAFYHCLPRIAADDTGRQFFQHICQPTIAAFQGILASFESAPFAAMTDNGCGSSYDGACSRLLQLNSQTREFVLVELLSVVPSTAVIFLDGCASALRKLAEGQWLWIHGCFPLARDGIVSRRALISLHSDSGALMNALWTSSEPDIERRFVLHPVRLGRQSVSVVVSGPSYRAQLRGDVGTKRARSSGGGEGGSSGGEGVTGVQLRIVFSCSQGIVPCCAVFAVMALLWNKAGLAGERSFQGWTNSDMMRVLDDCRSMYTTLQLNPLTERYIEYRFIPRRIDYSDGSFALHQPCQESLVAFQNLLQGGDRNGLGPDGTQVCAGLMAFNGRGPAEGECDCVSFGLRTVDEATGTAVLQIMLDAMVSNSCVIVLGEGACSVQRLRYGMWVLFDSHINIDPVDGHSRGPQPHPDARPLGPGAVAVAFRSTLALVESLRTRRAFARDSDVVQLSVQLHPVKLERTPSCVSAELTRPVWVNNQVLPLAPLRNLLRTNAATDGNMYVNRVSQDELQATMTTQRVVRETAIGTYISRENVRRAAAQLGLGGARHTNVQRAEIDYSLVTDLRGNDTDSSEDREEDTLTRVIGLPANAGPLHNTLRVFETTALSVPPWPCRLCDEAFHSEADLLVHICGYHYMSLEFYRARVLHLQVRDDHPPAVTSQQGRLSVEAFTEGFIHGHQKGLDSDSQPIRCLVACTVCAELSWNTQEEVVFAPLLGDGSNGVLTRHLHRLCQLLDPLRYSAKWPRIPVTELLSSAVTLPSGDLLLLHKRAVVRAGALLWSDEHHTMVVDTNKDLPFCVRCHKSLRGGRLSMFALANDNWVGRLPAVLRNNTLVMKLLLRRVRSGVLKLMLTEGRVRAMPQHVDTRSMTSMGALTGNTIFFPQADASEVVSTLPPESLHEQLAIVFTGPDREVAERCAALRVDPIDFMAAASFLRECNENYADVVLDPERVANLPAVICDAISHMPGLDTGLREAGPAQAIARPERVADTESDSEEGGDGNYVAQGGTDDQHDAVVSFCTAVSPENELVSSAVAAVAGAASIRSMQRNAEEEQAAEDLAAQERGMDGEVTPPSDGGSDVSEPRLSGWGVAGSEGLRADIQEAVAGHHRLLVPTTGGGPVDMFSSAFWSQAFPHDFPYGDGVYCPQGTRIGAELTDEEGGLDDRATGEGSRALFSQFARHLLLREELEYGAAAPDGDGTFAIDSPLSAFDNAAAWHIHNSFRAPTGPSRWRHDLELISVLFCVVRRLDVITSVRNHVNRRGFSNNQISRLTPEIMAESIEKSGGNIQKALRDPTVHPAHKAALRDVLVAARGVSGSDSHRAALRHELLACHALFGPNVMFITPNITDTRNPLMSMIWHGPDGCAVDLSVESPLMPPLQEMMCKTSSDPVGQAMFFNLMMELFFEHVLGISFVDPFVPSRGDGYATTLRGSGVFGEVRAVFGPQEEAGRGFVHSHLSLFLAGEPDEAFVRKIKSLKAGTLAGVSLATVMGTWCERTTERVRAMQFDSVVVELPLHLGDPCLPQPGEASPVMPFTAEMAMNSKFDGQPEGDDQNTFRPFIPVTPFPADSFADQDRAAAHDAHERCPLTGATIARLPMYRRRRLRAWHGCQTPVTRRNEARRWSRLFYRDAIAVKSRSNIHKCTNSCFKYETKQHTLRFCRHNFFHGVRLRFSGMARKMKLRRGKVLEKKVRIVGNNAGGRQGKIILPRAHPFEGSSNPFVDVAMRCNVDIQCMQRLPVQCGDDETALRFLALEATGHVDAAAAHAALARASEDLHTSARSADDVEGCDSNKMPAPQPLTVLDYNEWLVLHYGTVDLNMALSALERWAADSLVHVLHDDATGTDSGYALALPLSRGQDRDMRHIRFTLVDVPDADALRVAEMLSSIAEAFRHAQDQAYYTCNYSVKPLPNLTPVMERQQQGVQDLYDRGMMDNASAVTKATRLLIRMQTAEGRSKYWSGMTMAHFLLFEHECRKSHTPWTLQMTWQLWAAGESFRRREHPNREGKKFAPGGGRAPVAAVVHTTDPIAPAEDDDGNPVVEAQESGAPLPTAARRLVLLAPTTRSHYLHRGTHAIVAQMGQYQYAMYVRHQALPKNKKLRPQLLSAWNEVPYEKHYLLYKSHFQFILLAPRVPVLDGWALSTVHEDPQKNAMFKSVLFRPHSCPGVDADNSCMDVKAFDKLSIVSRDPSRTGFSEPFLKWEERNSRRSRLAERFCSVHGIVPNLYLFWVLGNSGKEETLEVLEHDRAKRIGWLWAKIAESVLFNLEQGAQARARPHRRPNNELFAEAELGDHAGDIGGIDLEYGDFDMSAPGLLQQPLTKYRLSSSQRSMYFFHDGPGYSYSSNQSHKLVVARNRSCNGMPPRAGGADTIVQAARAARCANPRSRNERGVSPSAFLGVVDRQETTTAMAVAAYETARHSWKKAALSPTSKTAQVLRSAGFSGRVTEAGLEFCPADGADVAAMALALAVDAKCSEEQLDVVALCVKTLVHAYDNPGAQTPQLFLLVLGAGGTGKTMVVNLIIRRLVRILYGQAAERTVCFTNAGARVLGDHATTMHASMKMMAVRSITTKGLASHCRQKQNALYEEYGGPEETTGTGAMAGRVMLMILDEMSQTEPQLVYGWHYCASFGRACNMAQHMETPFGLTPLVVFLGDFMQLRPIASPSLVDHAVPLSELRGDPPSPETREGWSLYKRATHVLTLTKTKRFLDEDLGPFLAAMRAGGPIPDRLWDAFRATWVNENISMKARNTAGKLVDSRLHGHGAWKDATYIAMEWALTVRETSRRAYGDAFEQGVMLVVCQACDLFSTAFSPTDNEALYRQSNMKAHGGGMHHMLGLHVGQRVRLTKKVSVSQGLVQEAIGTVTGFQFHPNEDVSWQDDPHHHNWVEGITFLTFLPLAVYVAFDEHVPVPESPGVPATEGTCFCDGMESGVYALPPLLEKQAKYTKAGQTVTYRRRQIPLTPHNGMNVGNSQGVTLDYVVVDMTECRWCKGSSRWLHIYVMLSRARRMDRMVVINKAPREFFEQGPPKEVQAELQRLDNLEIQTKVQAAAARNELGWRANPTTGIPSVPDPAGQTDPGNPIRSCFPDTQLRMPLSSTQSGAASPAIVLGAPHGRTDPGSLVRSSLLDTQIRMPVSTTQFGPASPAATVPGALSSSTMQGEFEASSAFSWGYVPFLCDVFLWQHSRLDEIKQAVNSRAQDAQLWDNLVVRTRSVFFHVQSVAEQRRGGPTPDTWRLWSVLKAFADAHAPRVVRLGDPYLHDYVQNSLFAVEEEVASTRGRRWYESSQLGDLLNSGTAVPGPVHFLRTACQYAVENGHNAADERRPPRTASLVSAGEDQNGLYRVNISSVGAVLTSLLDDMIRNPAYAGEAIRPSTGVSDWSSLGYMPFLCDVFRWDHSQLLSAFLCDVFRWDHSQLLSARQTVNTIAQDPTQWQRLVVRTRSVFFYVQSVFEQRFGARQPNPVGLWAVLAEFANSHAPGQPGDGDPYLETSNQNRLLALEEQISTCSGTWWREQLPKPSVTGIPYPMPVHFLGHPCVHNVDAGSGLPVLITAELITAATDQRGLDSVNESSARAILTATLDLGSCINTV